MKTTKSKMELKRSYKMTSISKRQIKVQKAIENLKANNTARDSTPTTAPPTRQVGWFISPSLFGNF